MSTGRKIRRLKPKKIKGRVKLLKAMLYKGIMLCVRLIGTDMFEYLFAYNGGVYTNYMIITPRKGETKLDEEGIRTGMQMIWAGGESSIDMLLGDQIDEKQQAIVNTFEGARKSAEKMIKSKKVNKKLLN